MIPVLRCGWPVSVAQEKQNRSPAPRHSAKVFCFFLLVVMAIFLKAPERILGATGAPGQTETHSPKSTVAPAGNAERGKQLFRKDGCYECHGSHGQIASRAGPALAPNLILFEPFVSYIRRPTGSMPAYSQKVLSNQDVADIYAFLQETPRPPPANSIPVLNSAGEIRRGRGVPSHGE